MVDAVGISRAASPALLDQSTDPVSRPLSKRAQQWTLIVACLALSLVMASLVALNTALADIARETSASQTQLTWIVDSYTVVMACLLLPAGAIGDRYGRRGALVLGLAIFAVASVIPLLRSDPGTLIAGRAAAGLGAAFIMPATLSLITAAHPPERRTRAVGIWAGIAGCGGILGMLGSGVLLHFWSWKSIFWGFLGAAVGLAVIGLTIATSKDPESKPIDWRGAAVIAAAVAVFVFGILEAPARGWSDPVVYGCLIIGVLLAGAFGVVELRRPHPHHGLVEQQRAPACVVARYQCQVQVATGHPRYEGGGLLAVQFYLHRAVPGRKAFEHGREVARCIVIRHPQPHPACECVAVQGVMCFCMQLQNAAGVAQQGFTLGREVLLAGIALQQSVAYGVFQLLELHADRRLGPVHLGRRARERACIHHRHQALEPVELQVAVAHGLPLW